VVDFNRDEPDIRPDNPAFFYIRYPAGYQIACRISGRISSIRQDIQYPTFGLAGYPAKTVSGTSLVFKI
jgi:hypothetical protein